MDKDKLWIILIGVLLVMALGLGGTINLLFQVLDAFFQMMKALNNALMAAGQDSILAFLFQTQISYAITGLILSALFTGFGIWLGKAGAKILYALVALGVVAILNFLAVLIF